MLWYVVNPASDFFRPVGMLFYWIALHVFDRNAFGYHCLLWSLHAVNVALVYWILRRFTLTQLGSSAGALLFASQAVFNDIYWTFGTIFEVVGTMLYFVGILIWSKQHRAVTTVILASVIFLLALKTKEMAITLPAIWLAYDVLVRQESRSRTLVQLAAPVALGAWYGLRKLDEMQGTSRDHPYYMDLSLLTLGRGFGGYFNMLFAAEWRWQVWAIGFTLILLILALLRKKVAVFFQLYTFITFLPVIFLANHREPFYWYLPSLGLCGLASLIGRDVSRFAVTSVPKRLHVPIASALLVVLSVGNHVRTRDLTEDRRSLQRGIARDHRAFIEGLRSLPAPAKDETLFFRSLPEYLNPTVLQPATQVALRRTDVSAQVVESFPAGARYRLSFEQSKLIAEPPL
jgi:hypothetical protein